MSDLSDPAWIKCERGHEVRVLPMGREVLLQVRAGGASATTTVLGPTPWRALIEALGDEGERRPSATTSRSVNNQGEESPRMQKWRALADEYPRSHCCKAPLIVQSGAGVYCDHCAQPRLA